MENQFKSAFEVFLNTLKDRKNVADEYLGIQEELKKEMEIFNSEKQRKVASSEEELSKLVLTA